MNAISETNLPGMTYRGKVRDTYDLGDGRMLMIATDRISAFDVVIPTPITGKGAILTRMSKFWFDLLADVMPNHMIAPAYDAEAMNSVDRIGVLNDLPDELALRSMVIKKAERIDIECVVRAYITGSAWAEYTKSGTVNSARMPEGMIEADQFPEFLFTPSTKAEEGHDEPMTTQEVIDMVGTEMARNLEDTSIKVFTKAHDYARDKGMILADTKFEFGIIDGELTLIDEVLTPDSSRFWDIDD
jgi:phosphoribosylaminoimidazole-succinocarboxamide synthase